ncbi:MAG: pyridoxal phosphate-dependent aminotransferase [Lachnospiraceae bacterium]|nr:pyridoxal phosphate-dependent aminotransferase [Lachnospiraceae bacterium]
MYSKERGRNCTVERNLDFDSIIDRKNTNCLKYDFAKRRRMPEDVLPLWVADMDFKTSSYIQDALNRQVEHGIFGYSEVQEDYFETVKNWMKNHYDWDVSRRWLIKTPGIVFALAMAVKAFTNPGDGVLLQLPVYYPFSEVIEDNGRVVVSNTLIYGKDNKYHIDFDDFERKVIDENIKLFFLCNPHNPVGRVWTREELIRLGDICYKHHVIVVSDEIHADFVFHGKHQVFANLKKEYEEIAITCTSPSKTFNLAGVQLSNIFIANPQIKKVFRKQIDAAGYSQLNIMGLVACEAAYRHGDEWYQAMYQYVQDNISFTKEYVELNLPGVTMVEHEGTYLVWLDFRDMGLNVEQLENLIIHKAKLWLDSGKIFGDSGVGFQRINVACPRAVLEEALSRIKDVLNDVIGNTYKQ